MDRTRFTSDVRPYAETPHAPHWPLVFPMFQDPAERRMPPRVTTTWKRKKRVERSGQEVKSGERERKSKRQPFKKSKETALFKVARGASVARWIDMVPETVTQVDDMLIPRSNSALFHKLLSAPERVSGTDRGGLPRLFKRLKDTLSKLKF